MEELTSRGLPAELQAALVLADVDSGEVRAVVGDRKPGARGFNRALNARRQVGSVIKPLVYLLALEHPERYSWLTRIEDEPITLRQADGSRWSPSNYDNQSHGDVTLLEALTRSYNQATVRLGVNIGLPEFIDKLEQLGVEQDIPAVPSTLLGAVELTPLEVAQLYQSLAAGRDQALYRQGLQAFHQHRAQNLYRTGITDFLVEDLCPGSESFGKGTKLGSPRAGKQQRRGMSGSKE